MRKILAKGKVKIICELVPTLISSWGDSVEEIEDLLRQYNYNIYLIDENGGLIPVDSFINGPRHYLFTREKVI